MNELAGALLLALQEAFPEYEFLSGTCEQFQLSNQRDVHSWITIIGPGGKSGDIALGVLTLSRRELSFGFCGFTKAWCWEDPQLLPALIKGVQQCLFLSAFRKFCG